MFLTAVSRPSVEIKLSIYCTSAARCRVSVAVHGVTRGWARSWHRYQITTTAATAVVFLTAASAQCARLMKDHLPTTEACCHLPSPSSPMAPVALMAAFGQQQSFAICCIKPHGRFDSNGPLNHQSKTLGYERICAGLAVLNDHLNQWREHHST